jgi:hypothetical protein
MREAISITWVDFLQGTGMTYGERALQAFAERIEVKYIDAIRKGWVDVAVIVDMRNQDYLRQQIAAQRGVAVSEIEDTIVGVVLSGHRQALAEKLDAHVPGNEAAKALATETPREGEFPVLILTDRTQGGAGIHFFYRAKPEIPAGIFPTGILCEGQVASLNRRFMPQQVLEFKLG